MILLGQECNFNESEVSGNAFRDSENCGVSRLSADRDIRVPKLSSALPFEDVAEYF